MKVLVSIPVQKVNCKVWIERCREWSALDELMLLSLARRSSTLAELTEVSGLRRRLVLASVSRLMRFGLVEVVIEGPRAAFRASPHGADTVNNGRRLPRFPQERATRIGFVVERFSGDYFFRREVRLAWPDQIQQMRSAGNDVRAVETGGAAHEAGIASLQDLMERSGRERFLRVDPVGQSYDETPSMLVTVSDGAIQGLPEGAGEKLRGAVLEAAADPRRRRASATPRAVVATGEDRPEFAPVRCEFDAADVVVGGPAHRALLLKIIEQSRKKLILHSTFLSADRFSDFVGPLRVAVERGVDVDLLWGAGEDGKPNVKTAAAAQSISEALRSDPVLSGRVRMHLRTTGSHAKMVVADAPDDDWTAVIGSCNWLSSPFNAAEMSVVLRHPHAVASAMFALQRMIGRKELADEVAGRLAMEARDLMRRPPGGGNALVSVMVGSAHEVAMRRASGAVRQRLVVGSNRLGATAWSGVLTPGELAASRPEVRVTVMYHNPTGPVTFALARAMRDEAAVKNVRLIRSKRLPLHGKFILADGDDVIATSLNWASATVDDGFPAGEIGVHVHSQGIADDVFQRLAEILPRLRPPR